MVFKQSMCLLLQSYTGSFIQFVENYFFVFSSMLLEVLDFALEHKM